MLLWTRTILRGDGIEFYGYKKISLDEILQKAGKDGELKFMFARQIASFDREMIFSLSDIEETIKRADEYGYKVNEIILNSLQWKMDKFSLHNPEKWAFVEPQTLDGKKYYIAAQTKSQLKKNIKIIGDIYLDVNKISEMIKEEKPRFGYMKEPLDYLIQKGKVTTIKVYTEKGKVIEKKGVNILDFWGRVKLELMNEVSKRIFGIDDYQINEFKDEIELANKDKFDIYGYESTFEYGGIKLRFRIYDASHIYEGEDNKYKEEEKTKINRYTALENEKDKEEKINSYIALAVLSKSGYILLEGDPEKEDQKIREFYRKAKEITGYDILLLVVDHEESDYTVSIGENEIDYIINYYKHHKRNKGI